jgi:membrane-associated phospholipid phosphatase
MFRKDLPYDFYVEMQTYKVFEWKFKLPIFTIKSYLSLHFNKNAWLNLILNILKKSILTIVLSFIILIPIFGQNHDHDSTFHKASITHYIIPTILIAGGIAVNGQSFKNKQITWHNENYKDFNTKTDDILQFASQAAVFGLDWIGVKSKHGFKDKVGLMLTGSIIMLGTVNALKYTTDQVRPDGSSANSFPSGHTANAFLGATILAKEYSDKSILIPIGGYTVAAATGFLRMANNRHWVSDVLVGAGVGIISGEVAYIVYPWIKEKLGGKAKSKNVVFIPTFDGNTMGGNLVIGF